ncbi:hypothetical protein HK101_005596 [Irineochytrium annulatum]|nr:hypothetical protein HK101_005596 [Irineochytrium annulatum]
MTKEATANPLKRKNAEAGVAKGARQTTLAAFLNVREKADEPESEREDDSENKPTASKLQPHLFTDLSSAAVKKIAIADDLDPTIQLFSKPLNPLLPVPVKEVPFESKERRYLSFGRSLELIMVVDFLTKFANAIIGWDSTDLTLETLEEMIYACADSAGQLLQLYHAYCITLAPNPKKLPAHLQPDTDNPCDLEPHSIEDVHGRLISLFSSNPYRNDQLAALLTKTKYIVSLDCESHAEILIQLTYGTMATVFFHNYMDNTVEGLEASRKERLSVRNRIAELKAEMKTKESEVEGFDHELRKLDWGASGFLSKEAPKDGNGDASPTRSTRRGSAEAETTRKAFERGKAASSARLRVIEDEIVALEKDEEEKRTNMSDGRLILRSTDYRVFGHDRHGSAYIWVDLSSTSSDAGVYGARSESFGMIVEPYDRSQEEDNFVPFLDAYHYIDSYALLKRFYKTLNDRGVRERELANSIREKLKSRGIGIALPSAKYDRKATSHDHDEVERNEAAVEEGFEKFAAWMMNRGELMPVGMDVDGVESDVAFYRNVLVAKAKERLQMIIRILESPHPSQQEVDAITEDNENSFVELTAKAFESVDRVGEAGTVKAKLQARCGGWSGINHVLSDAIVDIECIPVKKKPGRKPKNVGNDKSNHDAEPEMLRPLPNPRPSVGFHSDNIPSKIRFADTEVDQTNIQA